MRLRVRYALVVAGCVALAGCSRPVPRTVLLDGAELTAGMTSADVIDILGQPDADTTAVSPGRRIGEGRDAVLIDAGVTVREFGYAPIAGADEPRFRLRLVLEDDRLVEWDRAPGGS